MPVMGGLTLALLSSAQEGEATATYQEIMGCETTCTVAAAGWPVPYVLDYLGLSVAGSAGLLGAVLGEDRLRLLPFLLTASFWTAIAAAILLLAGRVPGRGR